MIYGLIWYIVWFSYSSQGTHLYKELKANQWPIVYCSDYNIGFLGLERLHPFDSSKWGKVFEYLRGKISISEDIVQMTALQEKSYLSWPCERSILLPDMPASGEYTELDRRRGRNCLGLGRVGLDGGDGVKGYCLDYKIGLDYDVFILMCCICCTQQRPSWWIEIQQLNQGRQQVKTYWWCTQKPTQTA